MRFLSTVVILLILPICARRTPLGSSLPILDQDDGPDVGLGLIPLEGTAPLINSSLLVTDQLRTETPDMPPREKAVALIARNSSANRVTNASAATRRQLPAQHHPEAEMHNRSRSSSTDTVPAHAISTQSNVLAANDADND